MRPYTESRFTASLFQNAPVSCTTNHRILFSCVFCSPCLYPNLFVPPQALDVCLMCWYVAPFCWATWTMIAYVLLFKSPCQFILLRWSPISFFFSHHTVQALCPSFFVFAPVLCFCYVPSSICVPIFTHQHHRAHTHYHANNNHSCSFHFYQQIKLPTWINSG